MFDSIDPNAHFYMSFSLHEQSEIEEERFLKDNYDGLRILYTVNKYNEGVHAENIDTLIMGRGTTSVSLFYQQLGRVLTAGKKSNIQPVVLDLVGNIHIYQELVEEVRKVATKRVSSGKKLPGNKTLENFMNQFVIKDYELEQKAFLDYLDKNIQDNRQNNVIKYVDEIQLYCETFKEWPKSKNLKKVSENSKTSEQLYKWLSHSGYISGDFKYSHIVDKNNNNLKERLDELFKQYSDENFFSDEHCIKMVDEIEKYCKKFKEWPKAEEENKKVSEDSVASNKLKNWLNNSKYPSSEFKYAHVVDKNGKTLKERLDELFKQYGNVNILSDEYRISMVDELEKYCEKFKEWPKQGSSQCVSENSKTSDQLARWLIKSKYRKPGFKYARVIDENGNNLKERLDKLFKKYGKFSERSDEYKIMMVDEIEKYCETFKQWPISNSDRQVTPTSKTSKQLFTWISVSGYGTEDFKFSKVLDEKGNNLKERLDKLYSLYGRDNHNSDEHQIMMVDEIEKYCKKFKEWPKSHDDKRVSKNSKSSGQLYNWLNGSGYSTGTFKFANIIDENGNSLKERLDKLFNIFAGANLQDKISDNNTINLWKAKDSKDVGTSLYYLIVQLKSCYDNQDEEMFKYYKELINSKIVNNNIKLNINEFIILFKLSNIERIEYYQSRFNDVAFENESLASLYKNLYDYETSFTMEKNKSK